MMLAGNTSRLCTSGGCKRAYCKAEQDEGGNAEDVPSGYCWLAGPKASRCPHVEAFVARGGSNADNSSAKCHASGVRTLRTRTASVIPVGIQEETSFNAAIAMRHGREASKSDVF